MEKSTNNYLKKYHFAEHFNATYDHIEDGLVLDGDFCAADPSLWAPLSSILLPEDFLRIMKSIYRAKASKNIQELMEALDVESPRVLAHSCGFSECIFQKLTNDNEFFSHMKKMLTYTVLSSRAISAAFYRCDGCGEYKLVIEKKHEFACPECASLYETESNEE